MIVRPTPRQRPHPPIWIGGVTDIALRRAVRWGSPCFPGALHTLPEVDQIFARYRRAWSDGHDHPPPGLVMPRLVVVAETTGRARELAEPGIRSMLETYRSWGIPLETGQLLGDWGRLDEIVIVGDPDHCRGRLSLYRELGVTDLMAQMLLPGVGTAVADESMRRLATFLGAT